MGSTTLANSKAPQRQGPSANLFFLRADNLIRAIATGQPRPARFAEPAPDLERTRQAPLQELIERQRSGGREDDLESARGLILCVAQAPPKVRHSQSMADHSPLSAAYCEGRS